MGIFFVNEDAWAFDAIHRIAVAGPTSKDDLREQLDEVGCSNTGSI